MTRRRPARGPEPQPGAEPGLDTYTNNLSNGQLERRRNRKRLRRICRKVTTSHRVAACGYKPIGPVTLMRAPSGVCYYAGLMSCGRIWNCPTCRPKILAERAREIRLAVEAHLAGGHTLAFQTFTVSHNMGDRLAPLRRLVGDGFSVVLGGNRWRRLAEELGRKVIRRDATGARAGRTRETYELGTIRTHEVKIGVHGWHPHLHALFFFEGELTDERLERFGRENAQVWARVARERQGRTALLRLCPIQRVRDGDIGRYLSKIADEMARGDLKSGALGKAHRGRDPFELLDEYDRTGNRRALMLWHEWERGMHGARAITWSRGLKQRFHVKERSDEEIAAEEVGGQPLIELSAGGWWHFLRDLPGAESDLEEVAERGGAEAARAFLDALRATQPRYGRGRSPP